MGPPKKGCAKLSKLLYNSQLCKMKNINAIIFDLGGVILNINYQKTINEFANLNLISEDSYFSKSLQTDLFDQIETGKISANEFLIEIQKKNTAVSIQQIKSAWNAMLLNLPQKRIELIKKIRKKFSIYLLSNTNAIHIAEFKRKIGADRYHEFYNLFDKVYYSHEIGVRKPNAKAFEVILEENQLAPHEVFFIDDSIQHIKGAKKLGIKTGYISKNLTLSTFFSDIAL